jgi:dihydroorotate dehydrogenase electron transfer subunit
MPDISNFIQESATIVQNESVSQGVYLMRLESPQIAKAIQPAQFVQILTDPGLSPFLRRPFSALRVDGNTFDIIYDVIGPGTERMQTANVGDTLNISGPLGQPFQPPKTKRILLVAGGVGLVPLAFLAWQHPTRRADMVYLMGAANSTRMPNMDALLPQDLTRYLATDDGSLGHKGFVTELISDHIITNDTTILTCGPHPMMARVAAIAAKMNIPCYASLENHMACGFGACVGCVVEYKDFETDDRRYRRACLEGPVVDAAAIVW